MKEFLNALKVINDYKMQISKHFDMVKMKIEKAEILSPYSIISDNQISPRLIAVFMRLGVNIHTNRLIDLQHLREPVVIKTNGCGVAVLNELKTLMLKAGLTMRPE